MGRRSGLDIEISQCFKEMTAGTDLSVQELAKDRLKALMILQSREGKVRALRVENAKLKQEVRRLKSELQLRPQAPQQIAKPSEAID
jgi:hypothetical protein